MPRQRKGAARFAVHRLADDDPEVKGAGKWMAECEECYAKVLYHPYLTTLDGVNRFLSNHQCTAVV